MLQKTNINREITFMTTAWHGAFYYLSLCKSNCRFIAWTCNAFAHSEIDAFTFTYAVCI